MRVLLVAAGTPPRHLADLVQGRGGDDASVFDLVIAVDGGADALAAFGHVPDLLVGDLDSVKPATLAWCERAGVSIARQPRAKDDTDLALAVSEALKRGPNEIVIAGATGDRLDHTLANIHLLTRIASAGVRARLEEDAWRVWSVAPGMPFTGEFESGATVSILPLTTHASGVHVEGFEWDLRAAAMDAGAPNGVSNVAKGGPATVRVTRGILAVMTPVSSGAFKQGATRPK